MYTGFFNGFDSRTLLQKEPPPDRNGQAGFPFAFKHFRRFPCPSQHENHPRLRTDFRSQKTHFDNEMTTGSHPQQLAPCPVAGNTVSAEAVLGLELLQSCLGAAAEVAVCSGAAAGEAIGNQR